MKTRLALVLVALLTVCAVKPLHSQEAHSAQQSRPNSADKPEAVSPDKNEHEYSGMYSFLKDGEFLQVTVEDGGAVAGFISRFGDGESDKGAFLGQFFKTAKLDGNNLSFTTDMVHGLAFDFHGAFERGEGKKPGDEAYYVLKGTLTENTSDASKTVTAHSRSVVFKLFPKDVGFASGEKK